MGYFWLRAKLSDLVDNSGPGSDGGWRYVGCLPQSEAGLSECVSGLRGFGGGASGLREPLPRSPERETEVADIPKKLQKGTNLWQSW